MRQRMWPWEWEHVPLAGGSSRTKGPHLLRYAWLLHPLRAPGSFERSQNSCARDDHEWTPVARHVRRIHTPVLLTSSIPAHSETLNRSGEVNMNTDGAVPSETLIAIPSELLS